MVDPCKSVPVLDDNKEQMYMSTYARNQPSCYAVSSASMKTHKGEIDKPDIRHNWHNIVY